MSFEWSNHKNDWKPFANEYFAHLINALLNKGTNHH